MRSGDLDRRKFLILGCAATATLLVGCASFSVTEKHHEMPDGVVFWFPQKAGAGLPEPALKMRVEQYWAAQYWRKIEARYPLEVRAFRERYDQAFYTEYYSKAWLLESLEVQDMVAQEGGKVSFSLKLLTKKKDTGEVRTNRFWDAWVMEEGGWYHVHDDPFLKY